MKKEIKACSGKNIGHSTNGSGQTVLFRWENEIWLIFFSLYKIISKRIKYIKLKQAAIKLIVKTRGYPLIYWHRKNLSEWNTSNIGTVLMYSQMKISLCIVNNNQSKHRDYKIGENCWQLSDTPLANSQKLPKIEYQENITVNQQQGK